MEYWYCFWDARLMHWYVAESHILIFYPAEERQTKPKMNLEVIHTDCDSSYTVNIAMGIKVILNMNILELNKIILLFLLRRFPNETVSCLASSRPGGKQCDVFSKNNWYIWVIVTMSLPHIHCHIAYWPQRLEDNEETSRLRILHLHCSSKYCHCREHGECHK